MKDKGFRSLLTSCEEGYDHLIRYLGVIGGGLVGIIMLIVVYDVVMRYIFNSPTFWAEDISEFLLIYCTYLGLAWVMRIKGHTRIEIVFDLLNPRAQAILNLISTVLSIFFCIIFTCLTWKLAWSALIGGETSGGGLFQVPMFPILIAMPLGSLLLIIQLIRDLRDNIRALKFERGTVAKNPDVVSDHQEKGGT